MKPVAAPSAPRFPFELPAVAAGLWRLHEWGLDTPGLVRWIEAALDLGVTAFDHADLYGGYTVEALFGAALAATPGLRERLRLVTKCGIRLVSPARPAHRVKHHDASGAHIRASVEQSLAALRTDRIDLLLLHRPDALVEPDEVAEVFAALHREGKVLAFGVSNHSPAQFARLDARWPLMANQFEFSPLAMQALADGTLDQAADLGRRPMAWSPLAGGRLFAGHDEQARRVRAELESIGAERGASAATVAHAWVMRHPARPCSIVGSRRAEGLREAVAAAALPLTREEWSRVWQASMGRELP